MHSFIRSDRSFFFYLTNKKHMSSFYVVETPGGEIYVGESMRKLTESINARIKDERRRLRHQGLSWLKTGGSVRGLYKQHCLHVYATAEERAEWLKKNTNHFVSVGTLN